MKKTEKVVSQRSRSDSGSSATKPSWMGDYSIGQVSGSLQSSGQKSSTNPTLTAMFGGGTKHKKHVGGEGEGGGVKKTKHKKKASDAHTTEVPTSEKKKNFNQTPKGSGKFGSATITPHKIKTDPTGQTKGPQSKHIVFGDDESPFTRVKPSSYRKKNFSKQQSPGTHTGTQPFVKADSKTGQSKHAYFGDDGDNLFPTSQHKFQGRKKGPDAKEKRQSSQSKHVIFGDENPSDKKKFKVKRKRKKGVKGTVPSETTVSNKEQSTSENGSSAVSTKQEEPAKNDGNVPSTKKKKNKRKRKHSLETKSQTEAPHKPTEKVSVESESHEKAGKKKKRRKPKKKSTNTAKNTQNVENKEGTEVTGQVQKGPMHSDDSKKERNITKKKNKRKRKNTAKDSESNTTNVKADGTQLSQAPGAKKVKMSPVEAKSEDATPKKRKRRTKKKKTKQSDTMTSPIKDTNGAKSSNHSESSPGTGVATPTTMQAKKGKKRGHNQSKKQDDSVTQKSKNVHKEQSPKKSKPNGSTTNAPVSDDEDSDDEEIMIQPPKKVMMTDKHKKRNEQEKEESDDSDESSDDSSDDEITKRKPPMKEILAERYRKLTKAKENEIEEEDSDDSSDDSEQLPKTKVLDTKQVKIDHSSEDTSSEEENEEIEKKKKKKKTHGGGGSDTDSQSEDESDDESGDSDGDIKDSSDEVEDIEDVLQQYEPDLVESDTKSKRATDGNNNKNLDSDEEDMTPKKSKQDPDVIKRTVFVGNLPVDTNKQELKALFKKYGTVESVRFRSGARADPKTSQKVAMITKNLHPERSSYNAYVVFDTPESAQQALKRNGKLHGNHHIRVDMAQNAKKHDTKHSVFVGNLPFDSETEPLVKHFMQCGAVEGVRLIRDAKTGLGKGFGYVLLKDSSSVELALKLDGSSLLGRTIRVNRALTKDKLKKMEQHKIQQKGGPSKTGKGNGQQARRRLDPKILQKRQKRQRYKNKLKAKGAAGKMGINPSKKNKGAKQKGNKKKKNK